jgi:hypothetical protein
MPDASASGPSLVVLGGPLKGKRFALDPGDTLIGSDPTCHVPISLPGVSPVHARLRRGPGGFHVQDAPSAQGVWVNDERVTKEARVRDADILWLGPPGGPSSIMISLHLPPPATVQPSEPVPDEFLIDEVSVGEAPSAVVDEFMVQEEALAPAPPADDFVFDEAPPSPTAVIASDEVFFVDESVAEPLPAVAEPEPEFEEAGTLALDDIPEEFPLAVPKVLPVAPPPAPLARPAAPAPEPPPPPAVAPPRAATPPPVRPTPVAAPAPPGPPAEARPRPAVPARGPEPRARPERPPPPRAPRRSEAPQTTRPQAAAERPAPGRRPPIFPLLGVGVALALGGGAWVIFGSGATPVLESVTPERVKTGQTIVIRGRHFGGAATVSFGERKVNPVSSSPNRIEAQVPVFPILSGRDSKVDVAVEVGGRKTSPISISVYEAPRVDGLSPDVAMPGEEIELAGAGWDAQSTVRFGDVPGEVISSAPNMLRVRVPPLDAAPGTQVSVVVTSGSEQSNAAPFLIGKVPIVSKVDPQTAAPGNTITISGRGFRPKAGDNLVKIGGVRAFVLQAADSELKVIVPWIETGGELPFEIHEKGFENVGQGKLTVTPPSGDVVDLRFVVEPLPVEDAPDHDHAVLATELGPVFVLSAAQGRTAGERAVEAAQALNAAAGPLKASLDADLTVKGPRLLLLGKTETILEAAAEDGQAYGEDWTHAGARNRAGSPARLSLWWSAIARDLVQLLVRSQKPQYAVGLAPEGRVLVDIYQAARKTGRFGVPRSVLSEMKPPVADQMRAVGLRLPSSVPEPAPSEAAGGPSVPTLQLPGVWRGSDFVRGERNFVTMTFVGRGGSAAYGSGLSVDILNVQLPEKNTVRFVVPIQGSRYYSGAWDGQKLSGSIFSDPAGKNSIGTFELVPGQ